MPTGPAVCGESEGYSSLHVGTGNFTDIDIYVQDLLDCHEF